MATYTMPDIRNLTEADAKAALITAGAGPDTPILIFGYFSDDATYPWDDRDHLGEIGTFPAGAWADTIGAPGTVSFQQFAPGETVPADNYQILFNLWGLLNSSLPPVEGDLNHLATTMTDWLGTDETTAAFYIGETNDSFTLKLTTLHSPDAPATELATLTQWSDLSVVRVNNDISTARVTISMFDDNATGLEPFEFALKVYYRGELVLWAPANLNEDYTNATLTISAGDLMQLEHHYIRIGDPILDITDSETGLTDEGFVSPNHTGLFQILACSYNLTTQDDAGWPPPGITSGSTADPDASTVENFKVERGMEVLATMKTLTEAVTGIEFQARPIDDGTSNYSQIDVADQIFEDKSATLVFSYGTGDDNLAGLTVDPLVPKTVAHVLDQPPLHRQTSVNDTAVETVGAWVDWDATDIKVADDDVGPLVEIAEATQKIYGMPLKQVAVDLRPDAGQTAFYGFTQDYIVGDIVQVEAERGNRTISGKHQITQVELKQDGWRGLPTTSLTLTPWVDVG